MLKIGTLVLYKNDHEPSVGVVVGKSLTLGQDIDDEDMLDAHFPEDLGTKVYPVKWGDMKSICNEPEKHLVILSEAK